MVTFNREFKKYKENQAYLRKPSYSEEDIYKIYCELYTFNLQQILQVPNMIFKWYKLEDIGRISDICYDNFFSNKNNSYLKDIIDKRELGIDIMENGTYWPIITHVDTKDNVVLEEGQHRIISSLALLQGNSWNGRKFIALEPTFRFTGVTKRLFRETGMKLEIPIRMRLPASFLFPQLERTDKNMEEVYSYLESIDGIFLDDDSIEFSIYDYSQLYKCITAIPGMMAEPMFEYKQKTGKPIKTLKFINDENEYHLWRLKVSRGFLYDYRS